MTLFIVTVLSLITWLPAIIVYIIKLNISYVVSYNVFQLVVLIQRTNSITNPIIYVFRMRKYSKLFHFVSSCSCTFMQPKRVFHLL
jgi:hypothetical protein